MPRHCCVGVKRQIFRAVVQADELRRDHIVGQKLEIVGIDRRPHSCNQNFVAFFREIDVKNFRVCEHILFLNYFKNSVKVFNGVVKRAEASRNGHCLNSAFCRFQTRADRARIVYIASKIVSAVNSRNYKAKLFFQP